MICSLNILFNHSVSEATPNSKITGAYCSSWIRIRNTDFKIEIVTTLNTPCFTNLALNNTSVTTLYNRWGKVCRLSTCSKCPVCWAT
jgi:hypothetical protein